MPYHFVRWFIASRPNQILSQKVKFAPTGVDEQAGILLTNEGEMATLTRVSTLNSLSEEQLLMIKAILEYMNILEDKKVVITYTGR